MSETKQQVTSPSLYTTSLKQLLEDRPDLAGRETCYRCDTRIGDAAYEVTRDGMVRHRFCNTLEGIIDHLEQCAKQNEADSVDTRDGWQAQAVAAEQRRMIRILKALAA